RHRTGHLAARPDRGRRHRRILRLQRVPGGAVPRRAVPRRLPGLQGQDEDAHPVRLVECLVVSERALVLGGGGAVGKAGEVSVIAGLCDAGLEVTEADLIIGTSAGAPAAAQLSGAAKPAELLAAVLAAAPPLGRGRGGPDGGRAPGAPARDPLEETNAIFA